MQTDSTTPNIVGPAMLGVVASICTRLNVWSVSNLACSRRSDSGELSLLHTALHYLNAWNRLFQTLRNNSCKRTQLVTSTNVGSCWPMMLRPFALGLSSGFIRNKEICKMVETPSKTSKSFPFLERYINIYMLYWTLPLWGFSASIMEMKSSI